MEVWKPIPSLPAYEASSFGRLRYVGPKRNKKQGLPTYGTWAKTRFVFWYRKRNYKVARLICEAFHGAPPAGSSVCMHLDEDSRNNRPENLRWGTQAENLNAPGFLAYCASRVGDASPIIKGLKRKGLRA